MFEYINSSVKTKPFFDFDLELDEYEDPKSYEQTVLNNICHVFANVEGFTERSVALAQRHRWKGKRWKVSVRAYVQGFTMGARDMKFFIESHGMGGNEFDMSVYRSTGKLGVIGGNKSAIDTTPLTAITHTEEIAAFLAQAVSGDEKPLDVGAAAITKAVKTLTCRELGVARDDTKATIEHHINNRIISVVEKEGGFDFDIANRRTHRCWCGGYHEGTNHYTYRHILTSCFALGNYSKKCFTIVIGYEEHPILNTIRQYPATDLGYAQLYAEHHFAKEQRIVHDQKRFLRHEGMLWRPVADVEVKREIMVLADAVLSTLIQQLTYSKKGFQTGSPDDKKALEIIEDGVSAFGKGSAYVKRNTNVKNVVEMAATVLYDKEIAHEMDMDRNLLGCESGVVDLRDGTLLNDSSLYVSMCASSTYVGIEEPTTDVDAFFADIFNEDGDAVHYMQKLLGYGITGHVTEQIWAIFAGAGSNGKGVLSTMLRTTLGDYFLSMHRDCLFKTGKVSTQGGASPHLAELEQKRIAICDESQDDDVLDERTIKLVTGGDELPCRQLYKNNIRFVPNHLPILMTNHRPKINVNEHSMMRRLVLVPFANQYVDDAKFDPTNSSHRHKDKELAGRLTSPEVRTQFLTWLVKGAVGWRKEGLGPPPALFAAATEEYVRENDVVGNFVKTRCVRGRDFRVGAQDFRDALNRELDIPLSTTRIKQSLVALGLEYKLAKIDGTTKTCVLGARLEG